MIGAIIGDTVGSRYEFHNIHTKDFDFLSSRNHLTDDSVMTVAIGEAIMKWDDEGRPSYKRLSELSVECMRKWGKKFPHAGYGGHFHQWLTDESMGPYNSCGNGSAMRVSAVGWAANSEEEVIAMSRAVTEVTHNHPDGIMGAESTAMQVYLAKQEMTEAIAGEEKKVLELLRKYEEEHYYKIDYDFETLMKTYKWHSLCDGTCQPAFVCLYEAKDFGDAIKNCIAIGGDCDTTGAICGAIAEPVFGIAEGLRKAIRDYIPKEMLRIIDEFEYRYGYRSNGLIDDRLPWHVTKEFVELY